MLPDAGSTPAASTNRAPMQGVTLVGTVFLLAAACHAGSAVTAPVEDGDGRPAILFAH